MVPWYVRYYVPVLPFIIAEVPYSLSPSLLAVFTSPTMSQLKYPFLPLFPHEVFSIQSLDLAISNILVSSPTEVQQTLAHLTPLLPMSPISPPLLAWLQHVQPIADCMYRMSHPPGSSSSNAASPLISPCTLSKYCRTLLSSHCTLHIASNQYSSPPPKGRKGSCMV